MAGSDGGGTDGGVDGGGGGSGAPKRRELATGPLATTRTVTPSVDDAASAVAKSGPRFAFFSF